MKFTLILAFVIASFSAQAAHIKINIQKSDVMSLPAARSEGDFTKLSVRGFETDKTLGAPELPVKSLLVSATPEQIKVQLKIHQTEILNDTKPYPVQEQPCRCETQQVKAFTFNTAMYAKALPSVSIHSLGAFRGTPISRVDIRLASYSAELNRVEMISSADVNINAPVFSFPKLNDLKDYLIVAPTNLVDGTTDFVNWKRSQGYNVYVETVASPTNDQNALQSLIKRYYTEKGVDFVMLIGDENTLPMFKVSTSGSSQTPSDLKYYTMDGDADYVPDVFASRIAANSADQVAAQLAKSIEYEQHSYADNSGLKRYIGIASNEGSSPSDNDYITSIEDKFKTVAGDEIVHLYQNDRVNSNPTFLNANLNKGAAWITYVGHGSGTSWPSMNTSYSVNNIRQLNNKNVVKPIVIDVACQNGRLISGNLGTTFMKVDSASDFGAVAYYGGSVNISWHPPAIMARGIAFEQLDKKIHHLGEALLAGQMYLAANWNNQEQVIDNFEWYHLQGDPGLNIE